MLINSTKIKVLDINNDILESTFRFIEVFLWEYW